MKKRRQVCSEVKTPFIVSVKRIILKIENFDIKSRNNFFSTFSNMKTIYPLMQQQSRINQQIDVFLKKHNLGCFLWLINGFFPSTIVWSVPQITISFILFFFWLTVFGILMVKSVEEIPISVHFIISSKCYLK